MYFWSENEDNQPLNFTTKYQTIASSYAADVNPKFQVSGIVAIETITTCMLCLVILLILNQQQTFVENLPNFTIGATVFLGNVIGMNFGGGCLNPLRSLLPWFFNVNKMMSNWPFIVGPLMGGSLASALFLYFYDENLKWRNCDRKY